MSDGEFPDLLRRYLAGEIDAAEAERRSGRRFPQKKSQPLGQPKAEADWPSVLDACETDEERQQVRRIATAVALVAPCR